MLLCSSEILINIVDKYGETTYIEIRLVSEQERCGAAEEVTLWEASVLPNC